MDFTKRIRIQKLLGESATPEYVWVLNCDILKVRKVAYPKGTGGFMYQLTVRDLDMGSAMINTDATEEMALVLGLDGEYMGQALAAPEWYKGSTVKNGLSDILEAGRGHVMSGSETAASDETPKQSEQELAALKEQLSKLENTDSAVIKSPDKELAENLLD